MSRSILQLKVCRKLRPRDCSSALASMRTVHQATPRRWLPPVRGFTTYNETAASSRGVPIVPELR